MNSEVLSYIFVLVGRCYGYRFVSCASGNEATGATGIVAPNASAAVVIK